MQLTTVGLDLAKNASSVHGIDERGNPILRTVLRAKPLELFVQVTQRMRFARVGRPGPL